MVIKKKILLIDDDKELCEELAGILTDEGYSIESAFNSDQGIMKLNKNVYDIVLIDFKLPCLNGVELLKKFKPNLPDTNFIFVTGKPYIEMELKENDLINLTAGVISKPIDIEKLLKLLKKL